LKRKSQKSKKRRKTWKTIAKYFVHGAAFSVVFTMLAILWLFGLLLRIILGSFIGLIIGFV